MLAHAADELRDAGAVGEDQTTMATPGDIELAIKAGCPVG